nr:hypothetical protein [Streptomyces chartreusis]
MEVIPLTQVAVDGVLRGNRHATEAERSQAVDRCGWATGVFDDRCIALIDETHRRAGAFPFGRRTYGDPPPALLGRGFVPR